MEIIEFLYASTAFIILGSFVPQLIRLIKDNSGAESISIVTVAIWTFTSFISLTYALMINGDVLFVFATGVFTLGNISVLVLATYNRYSKKVHIFRT